MNRLNLRRGHRQGTRWVGLLFLQVTLLSGCSHSLLVDPESSLSVMESVDVNDYYDGDWRGFDEAFDSEGHKFHALAVRHKVECRVLCGFEETIEIELSLDYLKKHLQSGLSMRLYGPANTASAPFGVPGAYIEGFLKGAYAE